MLRSAQLSKKEMFISKRVRSLITGCMTVAEHLLREEMYWLNISYVTLVLFHGIIVFKVFPY